MLALLATAVLTDFVPRRRQPLTTRSVLLFLIGLLAMLLLYLPGPFPRSSVLRDFRVQ